MEASAATLRGFFFAWFLGVVCMIGWNSYEVETFRIIDTRRTVKRILRPLIVSQREAAVSLPKPQTLEDEQIDPTNLRRGSESSLKLTFDSIFEDAEAYAQAPYISVGPPLKKARYDSAWSQLEFHEDYFRIKPHRRHVPTLAVPLSPIEFIKLFVMTSTAVRIPSHLVQELGWKVRTWTMDELEKEFPFNGDWEGARFHHNRANDEDASLGNMGAAVQVLKTLQNISRIQPHPSYAQALAEHRLENGQTRYIHNMRVKLDHLESLGIDSLPPFLDSQRFQLPTLWMVSYPGHISPDCLQHMLAIYFNAFTRPPSSSILSGISITLFKKHR